MDSLIRMIKVTKGLALKGKLSRMRHTRMVCSITDDGKLNNPGWKVYCLEDRTHGECRRDATGMELDTLKD